MKEILDTIFIIDIGSNSVRLAKITDGKTVYKLTGITRLSEGLNKSGIINDNAAGRTLDKVKEFSLNCSEQNGRLYIFATEAVRKALNGRQFAGFVQQECGVPVDILSGDEEAIMGYYGAGGLQENGLTVIDIGGASTEIICGCKDNIKYLNSIKTGVVTLRENCGGNVQKLRKIIADKLLCESFDCCYGKCVCIGGTACTLAAVDLGLKHYDARKVHGHYIASDRLKSIAAMLLGLSTKEIISLYCIEEKRADVIGGGALLLCEIVNRIGCGGIYISENDNIEGYAVLKGLV